VVVIRTPDGRVASDFILLDARRGVSVALDVPPRMTLGDRTIVAARLENAYPQAVEAHVQLQTGDGLAAESVWYVAPPGETVRARGGEALDITLPPGAHVWLYADVEAARVGPAKATIEVRAERRSQNAERGYEVLPVREPAGADAPVSIKRTISLGTLLEEPEAPGHEPDHPTWRWAEVSPQDRLVAGQVLRGEEEVVLSRPLADLRWSQRVPVTCAAIRREPRTAPKIGPREDDRPDVLSFRPAELKAGAHPHEYFLAVVRPGACVLPAPEVRAGQESVPVHVEPVDLQVMVGSGQ
jgi:hypothetical protein